MSADRQSITAAILFSSPCTIDASLSGAKDRQPSRSPLRAVHSCLDAATELAERSSHIN